MGGFHNLTNAGSRHKLGGNRTSQNPGCFQPITLLMAACERYRLVISRLRIAGIHHANRCDIHRRTAAHHAADAALTRITRCQLMALRNPFFRVKQPLNQHQCHQRIIRDNSVAANATLADVDLLAVTVPGSIQAFDVPVAVANLLGRQFFGRRPMAALGTAQHLSR